MYNREDILKRACVINYDRFYIPSIDNLKDPTFVYEYVQFSVTKQLDSGGYVITHQTWKKAQKGTAYDPCMSLTEIKKKMQDNEIRARKEMSTKQLRELLETEKQPLSFKFPDKLEVVVLPKKEGESCNEVYLKWNDYNHSYVEQRSIKFDTEFHKQWFNNERAQSQPGQDWRYLLGLNIPVVDSMAVNVLYKYFEGLYTGDLSELAKGTALYKQEYPTQGKKESVKSKIKETYLKRIRTIDINYADSRSQVCIKDPEYGNIIRIQLYFTGPFIKKGWSFVSKKEYKEQQKLKVIKRKEMAEDNIQEQLLKYKGPKQYLKPRGVIGNPYMRLQHVPIKPEEDTETITVKKLVPQYAYVRQYFKAYERIPDGVKEVPYVNKKGKRSIRRVKKFLRGKLLVKFPLVDQNGKNYYKRVFLYNKEEWVTFTRNLYTTKTTRKREFEVLEGTPKKKKTIKFINVTKKSLIKPKYKTIRVLQMPSKKSQGLSI